MNDIRRFIRAIIIKKEVSTELFLNADGKSNYKDIRAALAYILVAIVLNNQY